MIFIFFVLIIFVSNSIGAEPNGIRTISWDAVTQQIDGSDENTPVYYYIYTNTFPCFIADSSTYLATTRNTSYVHMDERHDNPGIKFYYIVKAMDSWGNESNVSATVGESDFVLGKIKILLEGAFDAEGDTLTTTLNKNEFLPLSSPYSQAPRTITAMPDGMTDWVLVELKSEKSGPILSRQSLLLKNDGRIVEEDGATDLIGLPDVSNGDYFVIIRHRNHLGVMSSIQTSLTATNAELYDFTTGQNKVNGNDAKFLKENTFGMYTADITGDGLIILADELTTIRAENLRDGYYSSDVNMDGLVILADELTLVRANNLHGANLE